MKKKYFLFFFIFILSVVVLSVGFSIPTGAAPFKICGNGICDSGENAAKCPLDCSGGGSAAAQCDDGEDNDEDGFCDFDGCNFGRGKNKIRLGPDPECSSVFDDSEGPDCVPSAEVCDHQDNDCDGQIDNGVTNDCGTCGPAPTEICDGFDNNCDGSIDEGDVCVFLDSCSDSDGGINFALRGVVSTVLDGNAYTNLDLCNNGTLTEYYCEGDYSSQRYAYCLAEGYSGCFDGACV